MNIRDMLRRVESLRSADKPAGVVAEVANRALRKTPVGDLLRGAWLGHPVHPILVTVPIGAWTGATLLDLTGERTAARRLVALGLAAVPPSVLAGLADYPDLNPAQRRVGLVHAAANTIATALLTASYASRRANRHGVGAALTLLGLGVTGAAGALGGHLAYAQGAGVHRYESPPFVRRPDKPVAAS
jgi:uncharacterized membrane protein